MIERLYRMSTHGGLKKAWAFKQLFFVFTVILINPLDFLATQENFGLATTTANYSSQTSHNRLANSNSELNDEKKFESKLLSKLNPAILWKEIHLNENALHQLELKFKTFETLEALFKFLNEQLRALNRPLLTKADFETKALYVKDGVPLIRINTNRQIMLTSLNDRYLGYLSTYRLAQSLNDQKDLVNYPRYFSRAAESSLRSMSSSSKIIVKHSTKTVAYYLSQETTNHSAIDSKDTAKDSAKDTAKDTLSLKFSPKSVKFENVILLARILELRSTLKNALKTTNVYGLPKIYSSSSRIALSQSLSASNDLSANSSREFFGDMRIEANEHKFELIFPLLEEDKVKLASEIQFINTLAENIERLRGQAFKPEAIDNIDSKRGPLLPSLILLSNILRERRDLTHFGVVESFRKQFEIEGRHAVVQKGIKICSYNDKLIMAMLNTFKTLEIPNILVNPKFFVRGQ